MAHVQDRREQGRGWVARYRAPDGSERSKRFTRKADAENWLKAEEGRIVRGEWTDPRLGRTTVAEYFDDWYQRQPWRDSTARSVTWIFDHHVLPAFGNRAIASLKRGEIESWAAGLPLAGRTARLAMQKLSSLLEAAAADGYIARNPVRRAKRPRVDSTPVVPFTAEELDALEEAAPGWFKVALTLGAAVGLRHGEATGLTVDQVDFLGRSVTVDRQLAPGSSGPTPTFGPLKTRPSYRTVPLADVAVEALARHVEEYGTGADGLVLHGEGQPVHRQRFGYTWKKTRERAGVRGDARFHDARHTFAAVLLSGGVSVAAVAEYMGHSPATLLKVYAHLIPADHDRARGVVQDALSAAPRKGHAESTPR